LSGLLRPRLTIELVPRPCWHANVRAIVTPDQWNAIRHAVFERAAYRCEICGWRATARHPLHCHETWSYQGWRGVQKLEGFLALCRFCHEAKHLGLARTNGREHAALAYLARINGWSAGTAARYAAKCFKEFERRSRRTWRQDVSRLNEWVR
jgi:hypothetical protein